MSTLLANIEDVTLLAGISSELKEIIRWMMEPDPAKRPTVDQVLSHQFIAKVSGSLNPPLFVRR